MGHAIYTHAVWRVREGREDEFVEAWVELGRVFSALPAPPVGKGVLIRSASDPLRFCSFGPWRAEADIAAMRANTGAQAALARLLDLCSEASPDLYRVVREVPATQGDRATEPGMTT